MADEAFEVVSMNLPAVAGALHAEVAQIVTKACFDIQTYAQTNHPFQNETGFAQSSIYVRTHDADTYGQTVGDGQLLPEVDAPPDDLTGYVGWGASYGIYLELGTVHMQAYPTMGPAAEAVGGSIEQAFSGLQGALDSASGGGSSS